MKTLTNQDIVIHVLLNKGASVQLLDQPRLIDERDGDVYAVGGAINRLGNSIRPLTIPIAGFDGDAVQHAIDYVTEARRGMNSAWHGIGFWVPDNEQVVVIDAIDLIEGEYLAVQVGAERGEEAIYSVQRDEVVSL